MNMTALEKYKRRLGMNNGPSRERWLNSTRKWINTKLPESLSYHTAIIDGEERQCAIISTTKFAEKKIIAMPGESLICGTYVEWMDNVWLITEANAPDEVYKSGLMTQCNYVLRWVNDRGEIVSRWVSVVDGTKYLTGEYYQPNMTVGDARLQLTMPRDEETVLINRNARFIIDDPDATEPQTFELSKINRTGKVFNGHGIFVHMMTENGFNPKTDSKELMIADYYNRIGQFSVRFKNVDEKIVVTAGSSFGLEAEVLKDGAPYPSAEITFMSSDELVAAVDEVGVITGLADGECTITATYLTFTKELRVVVGEEQSDPYIMLDLPEDVATINVGATIDVAATVYDGNAVVDGAVISASLDCVAKIATATVDGNMISVTAGRDRKNIGAVITLTVNDETTGASISRSFKVRGWT